MIDTKEKAAVTNAEVYAAFIAGQTAHSANLSTDGKVIRSYHYYELAKWWGSKVYTRAGELYSKTTSKHMTQLKAALSKARVSWEQSTMETDKEQHEMNLYTPDGESFRAPDNDQQESAQSEFITSDDYLEVRNEQIREARRQLGYIL